MQWAGIEMVMMAGLVMGGGCWIEGLVGLASLEEDVDGSGGGWPDIDE